jgi:hypothetical protein
MRTFGVSIGAVLTVVASAAYAAPLVSSSGLASPATTITFDEVILGSGTPLTTQYSAFGVKFSGLFYSPQPGTFPGVTGNKAGNFPSIDNPVTTTSFSLLFTADQTDVAFGYATNPTTTTLTALLDGSVVESFVQSTTSTEPATAFLGFTGVTFDQILISVSERQLALLDSIQLGTSATVPEPTALALVGSGLAALSGWVWRRRRQK